MSKWRQTVAGSARGSGRVLRAAVLGLCLAGVVRAAGPAHAAAPAPGPALVDSAAAIAGAPAETRAPVMAIIDSSAANPTQDHTPQPVDYLWVVRTSLLTRADVEAIVEHAHAMHVRGLLVQVVGRGDAYYRSEVLPRADAIREPDLDPLGTLLPLAHAAGLEVHAWMNCMLVWSAPQPPRNPKHVLNQHPEWVAQLESGRRMSTLSVRQRKALGVEGVYLSPGHPGVRVWLASIARELATRYPVDGIHLDYIRQPGVEIGFDMTTRARFALESGVDPDRIDALPKPERVQADSLWADFQRRQVTAAVRAVRDTLNVARPGIALSAAVLADTTSAERRNRQTWSAWLREGLLDRAYVMCYAPPVQTVMDQLLSYATHLGVSERVVPGIGVYNSPATAAAAKIKGARALGYPLVALYSYDALKEQPAYWPSLRQRLATSAFEP